MKSRSVIVVNSWARWALLAALACAAALLAGGAGGGSALAQDGAQATLPNKPNIVFVLADDMRYDDLKYMPKTNNLLADRGTRFDQAYVPLAMCCPSRASILLGQYAHNHNVWDNNAPDGGYQRFKQEGHEASTVATWLKGAGYRTGLFGKYLNGYDDNADPPPGWDHWFARMEPREAHYYDYEVNDQGTARHYGGSPDDYATDILKGEVNEFIDQSSQAGAPFFAYVSPPAPHGPADAAPRHEGMFADEKAPRPPSFDEADVSDKPPWIASNPRLSEAAQKEIDDRYGDRLESLQALDDMVQNIVAALKNRGELENTYLVFASDNGYHLGEHRLSLSKRTPYEEAVRIPMVVRGPGVPASVTRNELALNTDLGPTFADWAGIKPPASVDGRSLRPLLSQTPPGGPPAWRTAFLLENSVSQDPEKSFFGIRTRDGEKYVEYGGVREFYDLESDPYELKSKPAAASRKLRARLETLEGCAGESCRAAEDGP